MIEYDDIDTNDYYNDTFSEVLTQFDIQSDVYDELDFEDIHKTIGGYHE